MDNAFNAAILSRMGRASPETPALPARPPAAPAAPAAPEGEVAAHLAKAMEALWRTGPTPQNVAALEQFMIQLSKFAKPEDLQGTAPRAQGIQP